MAVAIALLSETMTTDVTGKRPRAQVRADVVLHIAHFRELLFANGAIQLLVWPTSLFIYRQDFLVHLSYRDFGFCNPPPPVSVLFSFDGVSSDLTHVILNDVHRLALGLLHHHVTLFWCQL